jgi:hypothetical protein
MARLCNVITFLFGFYLFIVIVNTRSMGSNVNSSSSSNSIHILPYWSSSKFPLCALIVSSEYFNLFLRSRT